ncbi:probable acetate kinase [Dioscorea cayenensis subsp. rotundata]|uniref:Probable acetate kinase n=1 Tax=Dioscorea cayennensis subsp. rotundata TaxID=55577 RepID=A0AB40AU21_DIOCR|nr:probable acetate kinase [Dioscorea cayenensis subsp. rotundata]
MEDPNPNPNPDPDPDPWFAPDKLEHVVACLLITLAVAFLAGRSRLPLLHRHNAGIGSIAALIAGAAKEACDELGLWASSGASARDAAADLLGVLLASLFLAVLRRFRPSPLPLAPDRALSLV